MSDSHKFKNEGTTGKRISTETRRRRDALLDLGTSIVREAQKGTDARERKDNPAA